MPLTTKPDFDRVKDVWNHFWAGEMQGRPPVVASVTKPGLEPIEEETFDLLPMVGDSDDSLEEVIQREMKSCIDNLQLELPEADRQAIGLVVYGGFKVREAAEIMGVSTETMKVRLHRARGRLQNLMNRDCTVGVDENGKMSCEKKCE